MKLNVLSKLSLGMLMVCAVMFFVGCSKDKEKKDPDFSHLPIIGVWQTIISEDYDYEVTINNKFQRDWERGTSSDNKRCKISRRWFAYVV
jgi:hypothetical protein